MIPAEIRLLTPEEVISVRWPVLRPGFPRDSAIFPGDDAPETRHFGAFVDGQLVGVASTYAAPFPGDPGTSATARQLRGMATLDGFQGRGVGRAVLAACEQTARTDGATLIWCNARVSASAFYARMGWSRVGEEFDIPTVGPHYVMRRTLD